MICRRSVLHRRVRLVVGALAALALVACDGATSERPAGITSPAPVTTQPEAQPPPSVGGSPTTIDPDRPPPQTCSAYRTNQDLPLQLCDKGDLVLKVQAEIALRLDSDLEADGFFGPDTERAVLRFQQTADLEDDGLVGPDTWNALFGSRLPATGSTVGIDENWFNRPASEAIPALKEQGFIVVDYEVCSGSVPKGFVRQIIGGDGTWYVDREGVTEAGRTLSIGEVVEVKIGSGVAC